MAFGNRHSAGTPWLPTGNPDTTNISSTDFNSMGGQPGGLGLRFEAANPARTYQRVQLDSGATASAPSGVVAANQVAYWKNKATYTVTNDSRFAMGGASATTYRQQVAGIFRLAATAGNIIDVCQVGQNIPVADGGNTFVAGDTVIAEADTTAAAANSINVGTAITSQVIGIARGAQAGGNVNVDIDIVGAE